MRFHPSPPPPPRPKVMLTPACKKGHRLRQGLSSFAEPNGWFLSAIRNEANLTFTRRPGAESWRLRGRAPRLLGDGRGNGGTWRASGAVRAAAASRAKIVLCDRQFAYGSASGIPATRERRVRDHEPPLLSDQPLVQGWTPISFPTDRGPLWRTGSRIVVVPVDAARRSARSRARPREGHLHGDVGRRHGSLRARGVQSHRRAGPPSSAIFPTTVSVTSARPCSTASRRMTRKSSPSASRRAVDLAVAPSRAPQTLRHARRGRAPRRRSPRGSRAARRAFAFVSGWRVLLVCAAFKSSRSLPVGRHDPSSIRRTSRRPVRPRSRRARAS